MFNQKILGLFASLVTINTLRINGEPIQSYYTSC
uniref:Uncharacterized protein n=1 Tax=Nothobranchius kuhntae TaxID=321403 RepID=A0A1A8JU64_NOTKU